MRKIHTQTRNYHSFMAEAKNLIRGYSWLFVVIRGYSWLLVVTKSLPVFVKICRNELIYHAVVYFLSILFIFEFKFENLTIEDTQYSQNM